MTIDQKIAIGEMIAKLILAVAVFWLGWMQYRLKVRSRHDELFDRRLNFIKRLRKIISIICNPMSQEPFPNDYVTPTAVAFFDFCRAGSEFKLLFGIKEFNEFYCLPGEEFPDIDLMCFDDFEAVKFSETYSGSLDFRALENRMIELTTLEA